MKRKLVKQGLSTLMVSLPSKWIKSHSLKKGDEVEIEERGELLLLCYVNNKKIQNTKTSIPAKGSLFPSYLLALYLKGYDEITLKFDNSSALNLNLINETIKSHNLAFSIIDSGKDFCKIKVIEESRRGDYENSVEKALSLIINLSNNILDIIGSKDYSRVKALDFIQDSTQKVINFSLRNLNKFGHRNHDDTVLLYSIVESMQSILGDLSEIVFKIKALKSTDKFGNDIINYIKATNSLLHKCYGLNIEYKDNSAVKLMEECEALHNEIILNQKNRPSDELLLLYSLQKIIENAKIFTRRQIALNP